MWKNIFYKFRSSTLLQFKIVAIIISIIVMVGIIMSFPHFFRSTYIVTIANKQVIKSDNIDKYFIYTQMEDGSIKVFQDTNSVLEFKFNSQDVYMGLRLNRKYEITAYGLRIPLLSSYENIIKVKAVDTGE